MARWNFLLAGLACLLDGCSEHASQCPVPAPVPLELRLCNSPWPRCDDPGLDGPAWVLWAGPSESEGFTHEILLLVDGMRAPILVEVGLPGARELPVALGDRVQATLWGGPRPHTGAHVRLDSMDGLLLYQHVDEVLHRGPLPSRCLPVPSDCGPISYPVIEDQDPPIEQGLALTFEAQGARYRLWVGQLWQVIGEGCRDAANRWIEWAEVTRDRRSACRCEDDTDCARGELCEPFAQACVPDLCATMNCPPETVCDPFGGACVPRPDRACLGEADCAPGELCHPITRACAPDVCRASGCAPCSPFLGGCAGCLHDCDCGPGLCDRQARTCVDGCQLDKLADDLRPGNSSGYDQVIVCVEDVLDVPGGVVDRFVPVSRCDFLAGVGVCPYEAPMACVVPLEREAEGVRISDEAWAHLCQLSRNPLVHVMAGGHAP